MTKTFKIIPDYPNYSVSKDGRIRSDKSGKILSQVDNGKGYKVVKLYNNKRPKGRLCLVHRIVLSTFNPIKNENLDVNHINGDKSCNILDNLEWVTKSENTRHAHLTGLFKNKLTIEDVHKIRELVDLSHKEIAEKFGVSRSVVNKIINGKLYNYV